MNENSYFIAVKYITGSDDAVLSTVRVIELYR